MTLFKLYGLSKLLIFQICSKFALKKSAQQV